MAETLRDELRVLFGLAWPPVLGQLAWMGMRVVDIVMVGHLGAEPLAAVSLAHTWSFAWTVLLLGAVHGLDPALTQAFGAQDDQAAGVALWRGALLLTGAGIVVTALHLLAGPGLALAGQPTELLPLAHEVAVVLGMAVIPTLGFYVLKQFLQADGHMQPAMWVMAAGNVVNLGLDLALIHGTWGAPALGAIGVAWATLGCQVVMTAALGVLAWPAVKRTWPEEPVLRAAPLRRLAGDAAPVGLQTGLEVWAFQAATLMMGWLGATAVAAHTVALNLASISFMVPFGMSAAAATRVGNLLGAGRPWQQAGWVAIGCGAGVMTVGASLFVFAPEHLAQLYTDDLEVVALAALLLPLAGAFQIFDGAQVVSFGVLRGAGDVRFPPLINLVGWWGVALPAGWVLAFRAGWGERGVWAGLVIGLALVASALVVRVRVTGQRGGRRVW